MSSVDRSKVKKSGAPESKSSPFPVAAKVWAWACVLLSATYGLYFFVQQDIPNVPRWDALISLIVFDELLGRASGVGADHLQFGFADRITPMLIAATWLGIATIIGWPAGRRLQTVLGPTGSWAASCLVGLNLLATVVLLLGCIGQLQRISLLLSAALLCAVSAAAHRMWQVPRNSLATAFAPAAACHEGQWARWLWRLVPVATAIVGLLYLLSALVPPFEFDVVEYHLQGPKQFLEQGRISFVDHNVYLNMPLATEMHALAAMVLAGGADGWWAGGLAGKVITATFTLLAAMMAAGYTSRIFNREMGWVVAGTILSSPGVLHASGCGLIDMALAANVLAVVITAHQVYAFVYQVKQQDSQSLSSMILLMMYFSGAAAAMKYTGMVFVVFPGVLFLVAIGWLARRQRPDHWLSGIELARTLLLACLVLLITVGPWLIKNYLSTHNPVYPLASGVFGSGNLDSDQIARWNAAHRVPAVNGGPYGVVAFLHAIRNLSVASQNVTVILVPFALLGAALILIHGMRGRDARPAHWSSSVGWVMPLAIFWIFSVWWLATHRIDRFWLPAVPLLAILSSVGANWLRMLGHSAFVAGMMLLSLLYAMSIALSGTVIDNRWFVTYETLRTDVGTDESPGRLPATIGWINQHLDLDARLWLIGEARAFHFERSIQYATCFNTPPGYDLLAARAIGQPAEGLPATHVLIQWNEIARYRSAGNYGFSDWPTRAAIDDLIQQKVVRPVVQWPFDRSQAELLEVIAPEGSR